ncbi:MAG TPA: hypothetical protein VHC45_15630 [Gaiellaceae bacterium]|jgi:hypothetical protein|nr:hypothetical protein [Gaiellaceae bacterium]
MKGRVRPEEIIGEWGVRDVTPPSQRERARLAAEHELNPLVGAPLRRRLRNFRADPYGYIASLGGPLPYMQRVRRIDEETDEHLARLEAAYAEHGGDPAAWRRIAEAWDFGEVNELIEKHNRWYPIEARLPMDPRTKDYVQVGGRSYRRDPLDAAWVLDRFPA